ncbi:MAG: hypothetical protein JF625_11845 [Inquilinus limosus]|uniref:Glycerophosphoryl diester phosphodiesterase membrane domain-containing protein n=1 Tax=Inquilinus limosus TaxID=171674 RepID=A0A952FK31_9PROT|nr:hypothetical protein [Inquilinus limosus]
MAESVAAMPAPGTSPFRVDDVLDRAFDIFRHRFGAFALLALIVHVPVYLFIAARLAGWVGGGPGFAITVNAFLMLACGSIAHGAMIYGVVLQLRRQPFSVGQSLEIVLGRLFPVIAVSITVSLLTVLGAVALLVPGLIVLCAFYVAVPVCVVEGAGIGASLSRSRRLTAGSRWRILGLAALLVVVGAILGALFSFVTHRMLGPVEIAIAQQLLQVCLSAFSAVVVGVVYHQLRAAKDGVDIETLAGVFD